MIVEQSIIADSYKRSLPKNINTLSVNVSPYGVFLPAEKYARKAIKAGIYSQKVYEELRQIPYKKKSEYLLGLSPRALWHLQNL